MLRPSRLLVLTATLTASLLAKELPDRRTLTRA